MDGFRRRGEARSAGRGAPAKLLFLREVQSKNDMPAQGTLPAACPVCCSSHTKDLRRPVACPACAYAPCSQCVQKYLLSTQTDPCCMSCGLYWTRAFLAQHLTAHWLSGPWKKRREHVLLDRERSLLPATQPLVEAERRRRDIIQLRAEALKQFREARQTWKDAKSAYYATLSPFYTRDALVPPPPATERRAFILACPDAECRGFLSTQYKCGTCLQRFCPACRALKTQEAHTCDPGTVETMALIAKECRSCPGCGMAITRVSGCDHMWCTACETGFSYATGRPISNHANTNPHMYERMRQLGALTPGDSNAPAGGSARGLGACARWPCTSMLTHANCGDRTSFLLSLQQCGRHVEVIVLPGMPTGPADTSELRVRFCLRDFDEARFRLLLQQREKRREQQLEVRAALEVFVLIVFEFFSELARLPVEELRTCCSARCEAIKAAIQELVNAPLQELANRYNSTTPRILTEVQAPDPSKRNSQRITNLYQGCGHSRRTVSRRPTQPRLSAAAQGPVSEPPSP